MIDRNKPLPLTDCKTIPSVVVLADGAYPCSDPGLCILNTASKVVCCDGAVIGFTERGGNPFAIVGDCDSVPEALRLQYEDVIHCDPDQETNDLTKAVSFCLSQGLSDIVILGATGKREDHSIGNIGLLYEYRKLFPTSNIRIVTENGVFESFSGYTEFESFPGQQVSVFCPHTETRITTGNLKFPLKNAILPGWWPGTLNESLSYTFSLEAQGIAIAFRLF